MNNERIMKLLEEIRDASIENSKITMEILEEVRGTQRVRSVTPDKGPENTKSVRSSGWDDFFKEKYTKNSYYIIALAVYHLTKGDPSKHVEKKDLQAFLKDEVAEMNGRNIGTDIGHTLTMYGYIGKDTYAKHKINAVTKKIVSTLPDEDALKDLQKKYYAKKRKKTTTKKK